LPDHPDSEQLAAFQAGDGDRRQRADVQAHLAGCPACAEVVASIGRARGRLASLEEPDLPPGLHDRLAAAVEAEAAAGPAADRAPFRFRRPLSPVAGDRPARRLGRPGSEAAGDPATSREGSEAAEGPSAGQVGPARRHGRAAPWYRRPVAWGVAAALLLAALVAVPLLDQSSEMTTAGGGGGGAEGAGQAAADAAGAGAAPVLRIPGEVSAATVRARLARDRRAKAALDSATAGGGVAEATPGGEAAVPQKTQSPATDAAPSTPDPAQQLSRSTARPPVAGAASLASCLPAAAAAADPATRPLTPAFYVEGTYRGREATILVTTSTGNPGRVDLWVFPRNDCSSPPLATERVR
jgi:hypothetical protein